MIVDVELNFIKNDIVYKLSNIIIEDKVILTHGLIIFFKLNFKSFFKNINNKIEAII